MNQLVLIGRIKEIKKEQAENGSKKVIVTLAVSQAFKNFDGEYDTNFIDCILFGYIADNTLEYCAVGDLVGIKGRIQRINLEKPMELIAEKLTFLSARKEDKGE